MELLVKLFNLLDPLLVGNLLAGQLAELRAQVWQDVGENGDTKNNDQHSPEELVVVCWQDVSIANSCASYCGPIQARNVLLNEAWVFQPTRSDPVKPSVDVSFTSEVPETSCNVEDIRKQHKCLNQILHFDPKIKIFQEILKVSQRISASTHL